MGTDPLLIMNPVSFDLSDFRPFHAKADLAQAAEVGKQALALEAQLQCIDHQPGFTVADVKDAGSSAWTVTKALKVYQQTFRMALAKYNLQRAQAKQDPISPRNPESSLKSGGTPAERFFNWHDQIGRHGALDLLAKYYMIDEFGNKDVLGRLTDRRPIFFRTFGFNYMTVQQPSHYAAVVTYAADVWQADQAAPDELLGLVREQAQVLAATLSTAAQPVVVEVSRHAAGDTMLKNSGLMMQGYSYMVEVHSARQDCHAERAQDREQQLIKDFLASPEGTGLSEGALRTLYRAILGGVGDAPSVSVEDTPLDIDDLRALGLLPDSSLDVLLDPRRRPVSQHSAHLLDQVLQQLLPVDRHRFQLWLNDQLEYRLYREW